VLLDSEPGRPFEALQPDDQYPDAAPETVRGDPGFVRLGEARAGGRPPRR
jgi:hypothetical protein